MVDSDREYVIAYGIRGNMVSYRVNYQDQNGNTLLESQTFYGAVGDRPVVAFQYVDGYQPQAYNLTGTLSGNEAENIFTFTYTPVEQPAAGTGTAAGGTDTSGGGAGDTAAAPGTAAGGTGGTAATPGTAAGGAGDAAAPDADGGTAAADDGAADEGGAAEPDAEQRTRQRSPGNRRRSWISTTRRRPLAIWICRMSPVKRQRKPRSVRPAICPCSSALRRRPSWRWERARSCC